jgi:hypothetical protein
MHWFVTPEPTEQDAPEAKREAPSRRGRGKAP